MTTINEPAQRVAMHAVRVELLEAQAASLGLPLWKIPIPSPCPNEAYERAMAAAVARAVGEGFTQIAFGDLFLEDVRRYREERLAGTGLTPMFPLFGADTPALARDMIASGLRARITCLNPKVLDRSFAGHEFDAALLQIDIDQERLARSFAERYDRSEPRLADLEQLRVIAAGYPDRSAFLAAIALEPPLPG